MPLYIYYVVKFCQFLYAILKQDKAEHNIYNVIRKKIAKFENIANLSNFFSLLTYALLIAEFYHIGLFLDTKKDEHIFTAMYFGFGLLTQLVIYTFLRSLPPFSIVKHAFSYEKDEDIEDGGEKSSYTALASTITGPVLTYFSNMMIFCSANTGMCTQMYLSTFSAIFGAFGVSLSQVSQYMFPITVVMLLISLLSLWIKKRDFLHKPFLLGCVACVMIIASSFCGGWIATGLLWTGNVFMIGAAIWNWKLNKLSGLPKRN